MLFFIIACELAIVNRIITHIHSGLSILIGKVRRTEGIFERSNTQNTILQGNLYEEE